MDETGKQLLKLLFDEGEEVCVSNNEYAFHSIPLEKAMDGVIELVSPNEIVPVSYCDSSELIFVAINPITGFRLDCNTQKFRSFLWEIDMGSIKSQLGYLKYLKVPLSAQVFSGNKSIHAITVLDKPVPDEKTYRLLYRWAMNILTNCDQNCKNPSRSIRIPGAYRDNGRKQRLKSIGNRVKVKDFMDWLNMWPHLMPKVKEKKPIPEGEADFSRLSRWCHDMVINGMTFRNGRNQTWFATFVDFAIAGFTEEQAIEILSPRFQEEHDFKEKEWLASMTSAYKYVAEGKNL